MEKSLWGAYGFRWKKYWNKDQIKIVIGMLKENPYDRRAVLQMWDPHEDLARKGKDVPCNTHIYFKIREGKLCMTVCNRSNDMLWGAYGANVVHMSMLQEYVAHCLGPTYGRVYANQ
jgi:thymidylate synthase